jgi:hypothetical protein
MSKILDDNIEETGEAKPARWKSALSVIAVVVIALVIFKMVLRILFPVLIGIILIANRDLVFKAIKLIYRQYKDETYKGLIATLLAFFAFFPFVGFLFFRSLYYVIVDGSKEKKESKTKEKDNMTSKLINLAVKEKVKDFLESDDDNNQR